MRRIIELSARRRELRAADAMLWRAERTKGGYRAVRMLVVVLLATVGLSFGVGGVGPGSVAHACSCMDPATRLGELQDSSDAAFVGVVAEIRRPEVMLSSTAETRFVFDVGAVYLGDEVRTRQSIVTVSDGASCGLELSVGATALVFARDDDQFVSPDDGEYASTLCDVIAAPSPDELASLGASRPPLPGSSPVGDADDLASTTVRNWYWVVGALAGTFLIITWAWRRTRSTSGGD